jgi:chromosomal replication initiator protein
VPEDHTLEGKTLWEQVLPLLRERMGPATYDGVLRQSVPLSYDGEVFVLGVPNEFSANMLSNQHRPLIQASLEELAHQPVSLVTEVKPVVSPVEEAEEQQSGVAERSAAPVRSRSGAMLNPRYNFESFVVADCNRFAHAAAVQVARSPGTAYNPLFIHSKVGLGKTHLLQAIGHRVLQRNPDSRVLYISAELFVNELISAIRDNRTARFRGKYRHVDVMLMDDIQFIATINTQASEEEFFHTFNAIYESDKQLVIACDAPPRQLQTLSPRVRSRLEAGIVADLRCPNVETRIAILEKKAQADGVELDREVLEYVAEKIESNIRVLEGALLKICAAASLDGVQPSLSMVEDIIADYSTSGVDRHMGVEDIVAYVSEQMDTPSPAILGPKRSKHIVWPRQVAMYLTRELTDLSLVDIGRHFGGRDHSTVLHAYNKVSELVAEDEKVMWMISNYKNGLQQP